MFDPSHAVQVHQYQGNVDEAQNLKKVRKYIYI